jgi:predicted helicase
MSIQLINQYYNKRDRIVQYGGSKNELSIRDPFKDLLNHYADKKNLLLIPELIIMGTKGSKVKPDGTLKNALRLDYGYWESKDEKDSIDEEIDTKIKKGYPLTNIIFEDGQTAILIQHGQTVARVNMNDRDKLDGILNQFISFEHPQVKEFTEALLKFKEDLPNILEALRELMIKQGKTNPGYVEARDKFLDHCRQEINPEFTPDDVREMIIQHILTEEIFNAVFDETHFHRENNIARELENVIGTFFIGETRRNTLEGIKHYYSVISNNARNMADHHEKQKFLKVIYENFYKTYNPKAADRLGVVYTPNEIVNFMIESTDYLLQKHFGKTLADKNVEILDPATGTGTFICDIIDYIPKQYLLYKYKNEIHANEVAILPYYVANLNIEYTYKQKMGYYEEFPNLCFVDTLDNTGALKYKGQQVQMFGFSSENAERIKRQNEKKISVIIGNPPYNANQKNENENNKNREYPYVDKRIKDTYIKESTAQKTKLYDMYARFYRWAMDRVDKNGIIAFITNRSFINSRTFDGFRKCINEDFAECYIIDTKSDVRMNPKIAGTTHNVFGIQTGVALMFLVKKDAQEGKCKIYYTAMEDEWRKEIKLDWLRDNNLKTTTFENITPDKNNNWINLTDNDFDSLLPIANKETKLGNGGNAIFKLFSSGIVTARDEWVYDYNKSTLHKKMHYFIEQYNHLLAKNDTTWNSSIKWSEFLKGVFNRKQRITFADNLIIHVNYRPFIRQFYYSENLLSDRLTQNHYDTFGKKLDQENIIICFNTSATKPFNVLASKNPIDIHLNGDTQYFPLYCYNTLNEKLYNIGAWGADQFQNKYKDKKIKKEDIFHYIYGVLHNPAYRKKYELNLKREFPRIPFYKDFWKWAKWGKELMNLHINYEEAKLFPIKRIDIKVTEKKPKQKEFFPKVKEPEPMFGLKPRIKVKLKADKTAGTIELDDITTLKGVPKEAWNYKLGNRSAIEWILDQYKEKKPKDPTIAEKFNSYRFADHKEEVIELLKKVTAVSIETMAIINRMGNKKE